MSEPIFVQCTLQRTIELPEGDGSMIRSQVAWLPTRFAKVGKVIRLHDDKEHWCVTELGGRATTKDIAEYEKNHKRTRKASDI